MSLSFDVVIIGGGINGAAIARDAALRGFSVALFEKEDFGSGASTKTSKLAHGGLRYLEHFEFGLVRESLRERALLLKNASHLTQPLVFLVPVYRQSPYPLWMLNLGLYIYDFLGRKDALPRHRKLSKVNILQRIPGLKSFDLEGGFIYSDVQMRDNRVVMENIRAAEQAGALVRNYVAVIELARMQGKIEGVVIRELSTGKEMHVKAQVVVNATGAWSNAFAAQPVKMRPVKGVHILLPKIASTVALLLRAPQDERVFFVIPWEEQSLVGTTDTYYNGNPDAVKVEKEDIDYLLEAVNAYFPGRNFTADAVISSYAGLRPLAANGHEQNATSMTRAHVVHLSDEGLLSVMGGKFTTHRLIAEEVVDAIANTITTGRQISPCLTAQLPLPGASGISLNEAREQLIKSGLKEEQVQHLMGNYGTQSLEILKLMQKYPGEEKVICSHHPHIFAEIRYAIEKEYAKTLEDWFMRRTSIAYTSCRGIACLNSTADKFAEILGQGAESKKYKSQEMQS